VRESRCAASECCLGAISRRGFLATASGALVLGAGSARGAASTFVPRVRGCFVRREGEYGMRWPGAVWDREAARTSCIERLRTAARDLRVALDLTETPLHSAAEADAWLAEALEDRPDGLLVVLLDRQEHAWPTATKAADTGIPTVVFAPVGTAFTTNTAPLAERTGCLICSTDDFEEVRSGLKALAAGARMRATRCLVIRGSERTDVTMPDTEIGLRYLPASDYLDAYDATRAGREVLSLARGVLRSATGRRGASERDVVNGVRAFVAARDLLEREEADGITMDCLGVLGPVEKSLPCLAWSLLNDAGVPAACEAELGAMASHVIVQHLLDRPGFQQDPVPETARDAIIGAHCSCPTRLRGFAEPPDPFDIVHHHGERDATLRPVWKPGERVTSVDVEPGNAERPTRMLIATGEVLENVAVPPAGGCVVSVMVRFDDVENVLAFPGFHQVFVYGDFRRQLVRFCQLHGIEPVLV